MKIWSFLLSKFNVVHIWYSHLIIRQSWWLFTSRAVNPGLMTSHCRSTLNYDIMCDVILFAHARRSLTEVSCRSPASRRSNICVLLPLLEVNKVSTTWKNFVVAVRAAAPAKMTSALSELLKSQVLIERVSP